MKKFITDIRTLAALLIASATFVACSSDDNSIIENQQPANPTGKYTMTINASKGGDGATTRALTIDGSGAKNVLNATWATTENVYVQKGSEWATGSLQPQADGATATLKGELSGITINANDELTLQFPKSGAISYAGQVGTLDDIAANFDYATATVEVESVSATGNITPKAATTTFTNQQAIIKFTLKDKGNSDAAISPTALTVTDGTSTVELTSIPAATYTANGADNVLYVAFPVAGSAKTVTLTATVGTDTYTYEKSDVTFTNGQYYEITVKMTQAVPALNLTSPAVGQVIGNDGKNYNYASLPGGVTAVAKICYVSGSNVLALALTDEGFMNWSTAMTTAAAQTPAFTGGTWKLATQDEWTNMITAAGSYDALRDGFEGVGGTNMGPNRYWSSTEYGTSYALNCFFGSGNWNTDTKNQNFRARACLAVAPKAAAEATAGDIGMVVCAAGHLHDAKTAVPSGCTAVGILGKVTATGHGLILALQDATKQSTNTINGWTSVTTYAGTTLKLLPDNTARGSLTSYVKLGSTTVSNWAVAQKSDYEAIFINLGSEKCSYDSYTYDDNVNAYITTGVGGTALSNRYVSASMKDDGYGWGFSSSYWNGGNNTVEYKLRPVLAF